MCGRYTIERAIVLDAWPEYAASLAVAPWLADDYNVTPSRIVPAIRAGDSDLIWGGLRWGLIPSWRHGAPPAFTTHNATIEKLSEGACWRGPWARGQRCLIPATGFYEWQLQADRKTKQPFHIRCADQPAFAFAGLWDASTDADAVTVQSCTVITMPASPLLAWIHNTRRRMPAMLALADQEAWLHGSNDAAFAVLKPYPDDLLVAWPVSARVNSPQNNDVRLIEPVDQASPQPAQQPLAF
jgi:putative SOS response-associated peptidase YedK